MEKIKINTQILGDVPNVKTSEDANNSLSPIILSEELSNDITEQLVNNINQNEIEEPVGDNTIISKTHITIKKEPIQSNLIVEDGKKDEVVVIKKDDQDLFVNYDSDFHKNEKTIMQRIILFKMMPKTRSGFVFALIIFTVFIVVVMMNIDPEKHSLDNYKASILSLIGQKNNIKIVNISPQDLNENIGKIETIIQTGSTNTGVTSSGSIDVLTQTGLTNIGVIEEENLIKERWLTVKPDVVKKEDGRTEYIYKGQSFSKESLQEELKKDIKTEIDKKIKDYLNKVYIKNSKK